MLNQWDYHMPVSVHFGVGARSRLGASIGGKKCLVVASERGRRQFEADTTLSKFLSANQVIWLDSIGPNPGIDELESHLRTLREKKIELVVGFGGGSCLDAAKIFSLGLLPGLANTTLRDLLVAPRLHELKRRLPLYAVPTTAGTGSEVTPFATVWDHQKKKKHSLSSPRGFPSVALVDPELTLDLPVEETISTGLDAINQAAESVWNNLATPTSLFYAFTALSRGLQALPRVVGGEGGLDERLRMAECSLFAGMAISQTRTALCHSISYPLTAHFNVPHGLACAFTMPAVLRHNLKSNDPRFVELEAFLNQGSLIEIFGTLNEQLDVRGRVLSFIPEPDNLFGLIGEMYTPERANNNLTLVDEDDIRSILQASLC